MKKVAVVGLLLFFLLSAVAIPVFAAKKEAEVVQQPGFQASVLVPVKASLAKLSGYLPKVGGLLLILVAGSLIAVGIAALAEWFLKGIRLEKMAKRIGIPEILKKGGIGLSLTGLITEIIFFLLIIVTLITALEYYGLATNPFTSQILSYIPHVVAAVFILILGILLAIFISGIITLVGGNVRIAQARTLGNIAKYAIIIVAGLLALRELGFWVILTDRSNDIILGGLVLAFAIAFGAGARDRAGKFLDGIFRR